METRTAVGHFWRITATAMLLLPLGMAHASPIIWKLDGVTFDDGGTAIGSFVFDADTKAYLNVAITTTAGTAYEGASYDTADATTALVQDSDVYHLAVARNLGESVFVTFFTTALSNSGGTVSLFADLPGFEGDCVDPSCTSGDVFRQVSTGVLVGTPIPEPASLAFVGSALLGLAYMGRRKPAT